MQVFVVSYQSEEDWDNLTGDRDLDRDVPWKLQTVCSSPDKADIERDELFKFGAAFVKVEQVELDGKTQDPIVVHIYDTPEFLVGEIPN